MKKIIVSILLWHCLAGMAQLPLTFRAQDQPAAPDYSKQQNWIALPFRQDGADIIPKGETWINDSLKEVDVFYIYPTLYMKGNTWCADVNDQKLNKSIADKPLKFQVSAFNRTGRIYSPLYRQGILKCFSDTTGAGMQALDFAYEDVKRAFEYYLKNYNKGRPIIIVSHSQGTWLSRQLLKDYFDKPAMKEKLVCAYVIGYAIYPSAYKILKPCADSAQTNCYVTWASFKNKVVPVPAIDSLLFGRICANPISWSLDTLWASSHSGVLLHFNRKIPFRTQVRIKDHYLWVKTRIPFVMLFKVLHLTDFNLYWFDIRKNAALRVEEYLKARK